MSYIPHKPHQQGLMQLKNISLREVVPFIDWVFFFMAWRMPGKYEGIEGLCECESCKTGWLQKFPLGEREKAQEALRLYRDAQEMLRGFLDNNSIAVHASFCFYPAYALDDDIWVDNGRGELRLPMLRQQHESTDGFCYSLADFIAPSNDYLGAFVTTVSGAEELAMQFEKDEDIYQSILVKTLTDRIAEAAAEWLHWKVRTEYWGYAPDENLSVKDMLKTKYRGIRPAVGYPSLPDQSIIFDLDGLLNFESIGVKLTENGAMFPNASVCGLYFAHPGSRYFMVGNIDQLQFVEYARRRNMNPEVLRKWLTHIL